MESLPRRRCRLRCGLDFTRNDGSDCPTTSEYVKIRFIADEVKNRAPEHSVPTQIPIIPDHEVLRVIGRGAYGEIWLARSLTGAVRAVKVVYRSTFESERAFQREFPGMP